MDKKSERYWKQRAASRLVHSERIGNKAILNVREVYDETLRKINKDIQSIYKTYAKKGILDVALLKQVTTQPEKRAFLKAIESAASILGININKTYDSRYLARLTRLEAIKEQVLIELKSIAPSEYAITTRAYSQILREAYESVQKTFSLVGVEPAFTTLNKDVIDEILNARFLGKNYSQRIYKNVNEFAQEFQKILGSGLGSGQSYEKTARIVRQRFDVAKSNATRLLRTETNYFNNQAELRSYEDDGIKEYKYDAHIDSRTSDICRDLDNDTFKVKSAQVGRNYPPMHPNCRSTTVAVIPKRA